MKQTTDKLKQLAYQFIKDNHTAALATVSHDGLPHVVSIYCLVDEDLALYFMTRVEGRKYINLTNNKTVAMVFTNEKHLSSIQLIGTAERVDNIKLEQKVWLELMKFRVPTLTTGPVPAIQLFERGSSDELAIIKVNPTQMIYSNFEKQSNGRFKSFFQSVI